jgi:hypothetical protein
MYAPKSDDNPYRLDDMKTTEERLQIALWYPFSVRSLIQINGRWLEQAICSSRDHAYQVMNALAAKNPRDYFVVVQTFRSGKEGREKAILFAPGENAVKRAMEEARKRCEHI